MKGGEFCHHIHARDQVEVERNGHVYEQVVMRLKKKITLTLRKKGEENDRQEKVNVRSFLSIRGRPGPKKKQRTSPTQGTNKKTGIKE